MSASIDLDFRNTNSLWSSVMAETLYRCGVRQAVVSPGSRSTPVVFALARHPGIEAIPVLDERSASFFALGLAKQAGKPVALVCTSGTAGANFHPAIIEASESGVPLIVITADRPPEMRECASGQTIDQQKLYGVHVGWYHELATPEASLERLRYLRQAIAYACERTVTPERGPVHLNAPFRDPLPPIENSSAAHLVGKIGSDFFAHLQDAQKATGIGTGSAGHGVELPSTSRGLIIAGPGAEGAGQIAAKTGWPVLVDALSSARHSSEPIEVARISAYDVILRNERVAGELAPEFVLCLGGWPTSKVLRSWLERVQPQILMAAPTEKNRDALHGRTRWYRGSESDLVVAKGMPNAAGAAYRDAWLKAEKAARAVIDGTLEAVVQDDLFEPRATTLLARHLPKDTSLFVASSMPVRDVEYFWPTNARGVRFYFNRGANGIDGTLSTALGVAHGNGAPAVLLTGDLSLLHDTNGFLQSSKLRGSLTIVLINNNGGGIFEHLPVAQFDPPFEKYFATPQNIDFAKLAAVYGVSHTHVRDWGQFVQLVSSLPATGVRILEIQTDRKRDTARRKALLAQAAG